MFKSIKRVLGVIVTAAMIAGLLPAAALPVFAAGPYNGIPVATGSGINVLPTPSGPMFNILDYGADPSFNGVVNQNAINAAIDAANAAGGGTVVIPAGDFKTYTIRMKDNVCIYLSSPNTILRAARQTTDGGTYDLPEPFLWVGIQDQGHSHYANSLIYAENKTNISVIGVKGSLITGTYTDANGHIADALIRNDVSEVTVRTATGPAGAANKVFGVKNCTNVITGGFDILYGGHFCYMMEGCVNWTLLDCLMDTDRDCVDIDCCQNVTLARLTCNSPLDDAIVYKASFGAGKFMPCKNVLTYDCTVSGYDIGSVYAGAPTENRANGTTGRVKWGTEATCGFDTFYTHDIHFEHCLGLCLESVDGAALQNVIVDNCTMNDIAFAPIFIRAGDRSRAAVTGSSSSENVSAPAPNVRLDDMIFVMPNLTDKYGTFPTYRYMPSYQRASQTINGQSISVINQTAPTRLNAGSIHPDDPNYANAVGTPGPGTVKNIWIGNMKITNVDPRCGILLVGVVDSRLNNITLSNIDITYNGGLTMKDAAEQRNKTSPWTYNDWNTATASQTLQWLQSGNNEELLPRLYWDPTLNAGAGGWAEDPYNIPEATRDYPEPNNFGVLPSYGMYARHVEGLTVDNLNVSYQVDDSRPAFTLDDVRTANFTNTTAKLMPGVPEFVFVTNTFKRNTEFEYVLNRPYITTTIVNTTVPAGATVQNVTVNHPSPATPPDNLYTYPTVPTTANPYTYDVASANYPLPYTVHRPFFSNPVQLAPQVVTVGKPFTLTVAGRNPGGLPLTYYTGTLPAGASFNTDTLTWTATAAEAGLQTIDFYLTDGLIPVKKTVQFMVSIAIEGVKITPPASTTLPVGDTLQLDAAVLPAVANQSVTWTSSDPSVATVDSNGLVTALSDGPVTITAASVADPSFTDSVTLTVVTLYKVTFDAAGGAPVPDAQTVIAGSTAAKPADPAMTGYLFTGWFTDSAATVPYDWAAPVTGNLTLYAGWKNMIPPVSITMSKEQTTLNMKVGTKLQLLIDVTPADASKSVTWVSSNPAVAAIDPVTGLVTALKTGSVRIIVTSNLNPAATCVFLVMINA